ncbi:MAG: hypothetical protein HYR85_06520 [Planctomycetes bacterium]|nr:hypothetical protein [Planctomycetota bacterium]MBI3845804.1 hypothetical protein [Planctomycetota bacterium]
MEPRSREQVVQEIAGATARRMSLVKLLESDTALGRRLHEFWQSELAVRFGRSFAGPLDLGQFLRDRCIELDFEVCDLSHGFQAVIRGADSSTLAIWYRDAFKRDVDVGR